MEQIDSFKIIGIATDTTNANNKAGEDLSKLWGQFFADNIPEKVPNKTSADVYCLYTDYESDYQGNYTAVIGVRVDSLDSLPDGLIGREFQGGKHQKFLAKGAMPNAVVEKWQEIWQKDKTLHRKYTADFEVYGEKSQNGDNSEVGIYLAVE